MSSLRRVHYRAHPAGPRWPGCRVRADRARRCCWSSRCLRRPTERRLREQRVARRTLHEAEVGMPRPPKLNPAPSSASLRTLMTSGIVVHRLDERRWAWSAEAVRQFGLLTGRTGSVPGARRRGVGRARRQAQRQFVHDRPVELLRQVHVADLHADHTVNGSMRTQEPYADAAILCTKGLSMISIDFHVFRRTVATSAMMPTRARGTSAKEAVPTDWRVRRDDRRVAHGGATGARETGECVPPPATRRSSAVTCTSVASPILASTASSTGERVVAECDD